MHELERKNMNVLVGHTGFVGSNLYEYGDFDLGVNSQNVEAAFGTAPDLLVYAGLRAEKYLANEAPEKDRKLILDAEENIKRIAPQKLVLISTIDVFKDASGADEDTSIAREGLHPYGLNRYDLECWVRENYEDALIIRLPGLFGKHIKKNFIYDYIHVIPFMLKEEKMEMLCGQRPELKNYYERLNNGFWCCRKMIAREEKQLKLLFQEIGFTALAFTDSRSRYQFYPLARLWKDMGLALQYGVRLLHTATEPVSAGEVYAALTGRPFENELAGAPADYDYRTKYGKLFNGNGGYIMNRQEVLEEIKEFVEKKYE